MYIYTNPNPENKKIGDCVIRAISIALNQTWDKTYVDLCKLGLEMADLPNANEVWGAYLRKEGYIREVIPNTCPDCYTIRQFSIDHPHGTYIVCTGTHTVAVIGGNICDSWDSSDEVGIFYFHKGE